MFVNLKKPFILPILAKNISNENVLQMIHKVQHFGAIICETYPTVVKLRMGQILKRKFAEFFCKEPRGDSPGELTYRI